MVLRAMLASSAAVVFSQDLFLSAQQKAQGNCRCRPGDSCWPSVADWAALNQSVSGRLLVPESLTAACDTDPSSALCKDQLYKGNDLFWNVQFPGGFEKVGYLNVFNATLPPYAVAAETADDISKAVSFASSKNLRLTIKNTGHDYLGRSSSPDALMIWTHKMAGPGHIVFEDNYRPKACGASTPPLNVVHVGAGVMWFDLYKAAILERGVFVVGGTCTSVGASGGYWQGGGYSDRVKQFASAAASVVEAEVVLADGSTVIADECGPHSDLFWALRGGGGGTFGVVTRTTYMTHPLQENFGNCGGAGIDFATDEAGRAVMKKTIQFLNATQGKYHWGGYIVIQDNHFLAPVTFAGVNKDVAKQAWDEVYDFARQTEGATVYGKLDCGSLESKCWWNPECNKETWNPSVVDGYYWKAGRGGASSYAYHQADHYVTFDAGDAADVLARATVDASKNGVMILFELEKGIAGAPEEYLERQRQTSMHPRAGDAGALICLNVMEANWHPVVNGTADLLPQNIHHIDERVERSIQSFRDVFPDSGSYANEGSAYEPNWQRSQWGDNYGRLASIKKAVDPENLFTCLQCVGSEEYEAGGFCKK